MGFKIPRLHGRESSSLSLGTTLQNTLNTLRRLGFQTNEYPKGLSNYAQCSFNRGLKSIHRCLALVAIYSELLLPPLGTNIELLGQVSLDRVSAVERLVGLAIGRIAIRVSVTPDIRSGFAASFAGARAQIVVFANRITFAAGKSRNGN